MVVVGVFFEYFDGFDLVCNAARAEVVLVDVGLVVVLFDCMMVVGERVWRVG